MVNRALSPARGDRLGGLGGRAARLLVWLLPFLVAFAGYAFAHRQLHAPFIGDEPHYALEAFSWADDLDRDLTNDYRSVDRVVRASGGITLQPQAIRATPDGPLVTFHGAGLGLLLAPAAKIGGSVDALQWEMIVIAAIGAQLLFSILARVAGRRGWLVWAVWAATVFSLPLVTYSMALYPELPAAVIALGVVRLLLCRRLGVSHVVAASLLAATLPWLHVRFGIVTVALAGAIAIRWLQTSDERAPGRLVAIGAALLVPLVVSLALLSWTSKEWYGSASPLAVLRASDHIVAAPAAPSPGGEQAADGAGGGGGRFDLGSAVSVRDVGPGLAQELFSARYGWLPFAPVGLLAVAGAIALALRRHWWIAYGILGSLAYLGQIASAGVLPGNSFPGRFELIVIPLSAVALLMVVSKVGWARVLFWPLAVLGAVLTMFGVTHASGLQPRTPGDAKADIGAANALLAPWPAVSREPDGFPPSHPLRTCDERDGRGCRAEGTLLADTRRLPAGDYVLITELEKVPGSDALAAPAATIDARSEGSRFVHQEIQPDEIVAGQPRAFTTEFRLSGDQTVTVRVTTPDPSAVRATSARFASAIDPSTGLGATGPQFPDLPLVVVWTLVVLGLAGALWASLGPGAGRRQPEPEPEPVPVANTT